MEYGKVKRGFKPLRKQMREKGKYVAHCNSCKDYYQGKGDSEETCQNPCVSEFDMNYEPTRTYCTFWKCEEDK